jgi:hypothetical protein
MDSHFCAGVQSLSGLYASRRNSADNQEITSKKDIENIEILIAFLLQRLHAKKPLSTS